MSETSHEATNETFVMIQHLYGLGKSQVLQLEEWLYKNITSPTCTIQHPWLTLIVDIDVPEIEGLRVSEILLSLVPYHETEDAKRMFFAIGMSLIAPFWEEYVKSYSFPVMIAFSCIEAYIKYICHDSIGPAIVSLVIHPVFWMFGKAFGLTTAVTLHLTWNLWVANQMITHQLLPHWPDVAELPLRKAIFEESLISLTRPIHKFISAILVEGSHVLWSLSKEVMNKLMHALNGNIDSVSAFHLKIVEYGVAVPDIEFDKTGPDNCPRFRARGVLKHHSLYEYGIDEYLVDTKEYLPTKKAAKQEWCRLALNVFKKYKTGDTSKIKPVKKQPASQDFDVIAEADRGLREALSMEYPVDAYLIDADQFPVPPTPALTSVPIHVFGVSTAVSKWKGVPFVDNIFIVPASPDAADDAMVDFVTKNADYTFCAFTRDKGLTARLVSLHAVVSTQLTNTPDIFWMYEKLICANAMSRALVLKLLQLAGIEQNPGFAAKMYASDSDTDDETSVDSCPFADDFIPGFIGVGEGLSIGKVYIAAWSDVLHGRVSILEERFYYGVDFKKLTCRCTPSSQHIWKWAYPMEGNKDDTLKSLCYRLKTNSTIKLYIYIHKTEFFSYIGRSAPKIQLIEP
jgi:hypothetical protein